MGTPGVFLAAHRSDPVTKSSTSIAGSQGLSGRYKEIRAFTETLCAPLSPEDMVVQPMRDASPAKWHLAHTTWFFETFVLPRIATEHTPFHPHFAFLFNSYYNAVGEQHARHRRGLLTRPSLDEVHAYRRHVDELMTGFLTGREELGEVGPIIEIGLQHEQQHQELILTDIKYTLSCNPMRPAYHHRDDSDATNASAPRWLGLDGGMVEIGHRGDGFAYDNEGPRHKRWFEPYRIADRLVTNGEYLEFMEDGGYRRPELWLDQGWHVANERGWKAPLYWERGDDGWFQFTLAGMRPVNLAEPVCHASFYEASAYAEWKTARLPTEAEWEVACRNRPIRGNFVEDGRLHPAPLRVWEEGKLQQAFGDVWEWTASSYSPYPGFRAPPGALGEYNGKFMVNQYVLRGGSCATSGTHIRPTYRNFFPADARWQFSGIRLAQ
jgi:ergothioneine biosynthesis protein EgtB